VSLLFQREILCSYISCSHVCGGPNRVTLYASTTTYPIYPVPTAATTDLPGNYAYAGCIACVLLFCWSKYILIDATVNLQVAVAFSLTRSPMRRPTPLTNVSPYVLLMVMLLPPSNTAKNAGVVRDMFIKRPRRLTKRL